MWGVPQEVIPFLKLTQNIVHYLSRKGISVFVSIFVINNEVSVDFLTEDERILSKLKLLDEQLKNKLLSAGFIPVAVSYRLEKPPDKSQIEAVRLKLSGRVNISV
ncbi:hypothetical protein BLW93_08285 [Desulfurobacterium indicum]|uniref:Flagellar hook-length control protein-like C-terminal domain-containing protein n=1 Tax=Desulfurobacterium indicum TaxID=1914305 RepID=A0A1R1MJJ0_9BACT|nr:hypothetical protein BLW93_08285 [Desulfurobacterium indicum]